MGRAITLFLALVVAAGTPVALAARPSAGSPTGRSDTSHVQRRRHKHKRHNRHRRGPDAAPGVRPGPALLYEKPAAAPQLTNARPWRAKPILVSGASAYRDGEFLYQDFLYDDHGAREVADPTDPRARNDGDLFS